jgi:hypothetical protein
VVGSGALKPSVLKKAPWQGFVDDDKRRRQFGYAEGGQDTEKYEIIDRFC